MVHFFIYKRSFASLLACPRRRTRHWFASCRHATCPCKWNSSFHLSLLSRGLLTETMLLGLIERLLSAQPGILLANLIRKTCLFFVSVCSAATVMIEFPCCLEMDCVMNSMCLIPLKMVTIELPHGIASAMRWSLRYKYVSISLLEIAFSSFIFYS